MDKVNDEDATASKKESLENTKRSEYYSETTQKWLDDADITVNDKVLSTLTITDDHSFTIKDTTADTSEDAGTDTAADTSEAADSEDSEAADSSEDFWAKDESQLKLDPPPAPPADFKPDEPDYDAFQGVKFSE